MNTTAIQAQATVAGMTDEFVSAWEKYLVEMRSEDVPIERLDAFIWYVLAEKKQN